MPTLDIQGRKVQVGEEFLTMNPEQQNAAVDEIAGQLGIKPSSKIAPSQEKIGTMDAITRGISNGFMGNWRAELQGLAAASPVNTALGLNNREMPTFNPIDVALGGGRILAEKIAPGTFGRSGSDAYKKIYSEQQAKDAAASDQYPVISTGSEIAGTIASPLFRAVPNQRADAIKYFGALGGVQGAGADGDLSDRALSSVVGLGIGAGLGGILGGRSPNTPSSPGGPPLAPKSADVVAAAERLGVDLPKAAASDSLLVQQMGRQAALAPFVGTPLREASIKTLGQLDDAASNIVASAGTGNVAKAGEAAGAGFKNYISEILPSKVGALYDKVDGLVNPNALASLNNTRQMAGELTARNIESATGGAKAIDLVIKALQRPEGMTYQGIKGLRTRLGEMIKTGVLPEGVSNAELKQIYGALSKDLEAAVKTAGGAKAQIAWQRANQYAAAASQRKEKLAKLIGVDGDAAGEKVIDRLAAMAGSSSRADIRSLQLAKKSLSPDEWSEMTSGMISRLGRNGADAQFSPDRFMTAWNKLEPVAKNTLFGNNPQLRGALDDLATVSSRIKSLNQFANPSGTAQSTYGVAIGAAAMHSPLTALPALVGARAAAQVMSSPASVSGLSRMAKAQEVLIQKPSQAAAKLFSESAKRAGALIASDLGVPHMAEAYGFKLMSGMRGAASETQPDE